MPLHLAVVAKWLLAHAGGLLFTVAANKLTENMGLRPRQLTAAEIEPLLDRYFHEFEDRITNQLIERMDEDRLVTLNSAIKSIKTASMIVGMTELKKGYLINAVGKLSDITSLPAQGRTGGFANVQLICLAYLGIAAIHLEMNEPHTDIAHKIVSAVYADPATAKQWFGEDFIARLLAVCPQCGTENLPGARYCKRDNYPLLGRSITLPASSTTSTTIGIGRSLPRYCSKGHVNPSGLPTCVSCGELITASYCSFGHVNMLGEGMCNSCGEPLARLY
jgi:hypothetical protein